MIERTMPLRAQWVKVADQNGHVHLEERWVVKQPAASAGNRDTASTKHAA